MKAHESRWMNGTVALLGVLCFLSLVCLTGCRTASPTSAQKPVYTGLMSPRGIVPPAASQYTPHSARPAAPVVAPPPSIEETLLPDVPMMVPESVEPAPAPVLADEVPVSEEPSAPSDDLPHLENGRAVPDLAGAPANRQGAVSNAPATTVAAGNNIYVVKSGDSMSRIAAAHKVKVADILALNPTVTSADKIVVGQRLTMPATATGDGLEAAPSRTAVPADGIYTVVAGDSLWTIGKRFGVRRDDIKAWNNLTDDKLRVGQQLRLRGDAAQVASASKPAATPAPSPKQPVEVEAPASATTPAAEAPATELPVDVDLVPAPVEDGHSFPYFVQNGDTLAKIAQNNRITVEDILKNNPQIKSDEDLVPSVTKLMLVMPQE